MLKKVQNLRLFLNVKCNIKQLSEFLRQIVSFYSSIFILPLLELSYQSVVDSIYAQSYLVQEILDLRDIFFRIYKAY